MDTSISSPDSRWDSKNAKGGTTSTARGAICKLRYLTRLVAGLTPRVSCNRGFIVIETLKVIGMHDEDIDLVSERSQAPSPSETLAGSRRLLLPTCSSPGKAT